MKFTEQLSHTAPSLLDCQEADASLAMAFLDLTVRQPEGDSRLDHRHNRR